MAVVVDLAQYASERRRHEEAEAHARALVLFECASALVRQEHPELLALVQKLFGDEWFETRVTETMTPVRKADAPRRRRTRRSPK